MNSLYDILLHPPLPAPILRGLLFFTFTLHFLFVLLTLGTAILGVVYYVAGRWGRGGDWYKELLSRFFVFKSLAVVLGVGPLLLMQVANTIPFFNATNLLAPLWLSIIVLMIAAFLLLEWLAERSDIRRGRDLVIGTLGLAFMLAVPAIFAALLATTERPELWGEIFRRGGQLPAGLSVHWLFRLLHVLGAAVLFTAAYQYMRSARAPGRRRVLTAWMQGAILFQIALGVALYASLEAHPGGLINGVILFGIAAAAALLWIIFRHQARPHVMRGATLAGLLFLILTPMLLTRQMLQDRVLIPLNGQIEANARNYRELQKGYAPQALAGFNATVQVPYNNPLTMYERSCSYCHGVVANGAGDEANTLTVPPENLVALRTTPDVLRQVLLSGVPGTAMPYFSYYPRQRLDELIAFVVDGGLKPVPEPLPVAVSAADRADAARTYATTCAVCHGTDGKIAELAKPFLPPPPDFTLISYTPERAFEVIANGYPGTLMRPFDTLPEGTRWGLVEKVLGFYNQAGRVEPAPAPQVAARATR